MVAATESHANAVHSKLRNRQEVQPSLALVVSKVTFLLEKKRRSFALGARNVPTLVMQSTVVIIQSVGLIYARNVLTKLN